VAGLENARWATADMAYRREALVGVGGFDEGFRRAYREDADLAARVLAAGWALVLGERVTEHPVGPADRWRSLRLQAGNADDVRLRWRHGRRWRQITGAGEGRRRRHAVLTAAGLGGVWAASAGRRGLAAAAAVVWGLGTAELAWSRIGPGPRTLDEVLTMVSTSALIPPLAVGHWLAGWARMVAEGGGAAHGTEPAPDAVLFDRDGTLVVDVPYNGDPDAVVPAQGAERALARLRSAGVPTAVITNQSGVARGLLSEEQVEAVNRRVEELLGPLGPWLVCTHGPEEGCGCRKPEAGLVLRAAAALGVDAKRVAVVGDIGADVEAARAAGARGILVPTAATRPEEVAGAPEVATDLEAAVDLLLGEGRSVPVAGARR
jgi:histidinol-phosphate phosphatase family protein